MENSIFVDYFQRKLNNSANFGDENSLPDAWKNFSIHDFHVMIKNLDKHNTGAINWKHLATIITLLRSNLPTDSESVAYDKALQARGIDGYMVLDDFV